MKRANAFIYYRPVEAFTEGGAGPNHEGTEGMNHVVLIFNDQSILHPYSQNDLTWDNKASSSGVNARGNYVSYPAQRLILHDRERAKDNQYQDQEGKAQFRLCMV